MSQRGAVQRLGQVDRGLAAELDDRRAGASPSAPVSFSRMSRTDSSSSGSKYRRSEVSKSVRDRLRVAS